MRVQYDGIHYDIRGMLSRNAILNIVCSLRGLGKTFTFKDYAIDDAIKDENKKFIYLRRYRKEFSKIKTFFKDIQSYYTDIDFTVKGGTDGGYFLGNGKVIGYYFPLSSQEYLKSVPLRDCNKLIFDEAFVAKRSYTRYLKDEIFDFLDIVETANRLRVDENGKQLKLSEQLRAFILGNSFSLVNPYFNALQITPDTNNRFSYSRNENLKDKVLLDLCSNEEFKKLKYESDWGIIQKEIGYSDHAIENKFFEDDDNLIGFNNKLQKCIQLTDGVDSIYLYPDYKNGLVYVSTTPNQVYFKYNCSIKHLKEDEKLIRSYKDFETMKIFYYWLSLGSMYFKDIQSKNVALSIFAKIGMGNY